MNILLSILAFLITIVILVGIHEYGHYLAARIFKVGVVKFSIGFGKPLYQFKHRQSGTIWAISQIPFGGYVQLLDERNFVQDTVTQNHAQYLPKSKKYPQYSFNSVHPLKKIIIILAGPIINFISAIVFFTIVGMYGVDDIAPVIDTPLPASVLQKSGMREPLIVKDISYENNKYDIQSFSQIVWHSQLALQNKQDISIGGITLDNQKKSYFVKLDNISNTQLLNQIKPYSKSINIVEVNANSLGQKLGLKINDKILAIDKENANAELLNTRLKNPSKENFTLSIERVVDNLKQNIDINIIPTGQLLGIYLQSAYPKIEIKYNFFDAIKYGVQKTWQVLYTTVKAITAIFYDKNSMDNLGGPVAISAMAKDSLVAGFDTFLQFLALISISLGAMNLLPLPVLDGGQALITFIEWISKRTIPVKVAIGMQKAGVFIILFLTIMALKNDFSKFL